MSQEKFDCVKAFKLGNRQDAEQLLPRIKEPADIGKEYAKPHLRYTGQISLLHLAAAKKGWMDIIIDLITKYKCDTNCKDIYGRIPVHYAASNNHLKVVRYFIIEQHCDPMARDNDGNTPLHYACRNEYLIITQYLISEAHCNPSCVNNDGDTPLHIACRNDRLKIAQYLISEAHCNPSCENNHGNTPLHIACDCRHMNIVKYLLSTSKANPLAKNNNDKIPMYERLPMLHMAAHYGWMDIIIDLITKYKCDTNCKDSHGRTPLHYAVINNHLEVVRYFINEQHCDPMTRDNDGITPLHIACDSRHIDIEQYLLSNGKADPLAKNSNDKIPMYDRLPMLHLAAHHGWMDTIIDQITKHKCDTNCKDSHGRTPLHYAVIKNHLEVVRYFINEQHCNPMTRDNDGNTPLHIACDCIHIDIVKYLLSTGKANPLAKNNNDKIPMYDRLPMLHLAAHHGWMDIIIDQITKYKCDTNCKDIYGRIPVHYAASNNHLEVVRYFIIEQHCDPMTRDNDGNTPLHYACRNDRLKIAQYLISEAHCNPSCVNNHGNTPLHIACDCIHIDIVKYLLSTGKANPLAKNNNDKTPMYDRLPMLHMAAHYGWMDIIIDLITKYKCDTNCKDSHGRTPLHYAVIKNHLEVVRYFINEQHCDPITRDNDGNTPLHIACDCRHIDIEQYLLSNGKADPLAKNSNDKIPMYDRLPMLHLAAHHGWMDIIIDQITKYKCDTNCKDSHGRTPLHYAVINDHLEVVRYFINEQHCDPMTRDNDGNTPLHYACRNDRLKIAQYLISEAHCNPSCQNNDGNTPLHYACRNDRLKISQYLISEAHCNPSCQNNHGNTPLHIACDCIHIDIVKYLLSTGKANPLAKNNNDKIPMYERLPMLHMAAHYGWMDIIIDLITKYKCDTNCKDDSGCTPLHYAVIKNHQEVVRYFINEQHCDPMTRDNDGNTPLHYACDCRHIDIVKYLLSTGKANPLAKNNNDKIPMYDRLPMLHLAAHHGWMDIIIDQITRYKCDTNCKDSHGRTPLHYAVIKNHLEVVRYFINEQHCDPMTRDNDGNTPLHIACDCIHIDIVQYLLSTGKANPLAKNNNDKIPMYDRLPMLHLAAHYGWMDIIIDQITKYKCDTNCKDSHGHTPLHYAVINNHLEVVRYFINEQHCDPMTRDNDGNTPLHYACRKDRLKIAQYLISEAHCNPSCQNNHGNTPLHIACDCIHIDIVKYLLSTGKANPLAKNNNDKIPMYDRLPMLHMAVHQGWMDIIIDLITKYKCDTNCKDSHGRTPLHYAVINDHLEVVRYFINEQHCNPMTRDNDGNTPLHYACRNDRLKIAQYLISEAHCNPSCENNDGDTPLHYACKYYGQVQIVQYLLSIRKVNSLAENRYGETPVDIASRQHNSYDLLKLFQSFTQCERDFPVHTYTKLILTGYSGAGKTTISQLILLLARKSETGIFSRLSSGRVPKVERLTAGIIPLHVESKVNELGNMVIYDFAGQQEYYSSHGAVLERIMRNSAAIFVCIVDLSQSMDKISESIRYWISFIENACSSAQGSSHVIIVGSHADLVNLSQELKEKSSLVESIAESRVKQLTYGGFVSMDCRQSKTKQARHFRSLLSKSQQAILSSQPSMSLYCHVLYAFLRTKLKKKDCTLQELISALAAERDLTFDSTVLTESLTSLSDKSLILFVQKQEHPQSSWVVVEKETLLREVNGTLFAPDHFKQYRQVASNTGIVPITTLKELFPQYSSEMLVGCLESMEFCHPVDMPTLQATNLRATLSFPLTGANYLFFPSLVKEHRPDDLPSPRFGWCLGCSDPHQYFSNRFLHVLLLRLAFTFPLASEYRSLSSSLHGLERKCRVWRNGICWKSVSGESTIVEIVDLNRWVIVLVSEKTREAAQTCSSVIRMILDLQHQLCSAVTTCECLISPSLLDRYPFDALPDTDLFDLPTVARAMLLHHKLLLDRKNGKNEFSTDEALSCEPYYLLQPSSVCQLFNQSMASQPVPDSLLQEVLSYCQLPHQKPRDQHELRECINKHSIFAGRNPLVSRV